MVNSSGSTDKTESKVINKGETKQTAPNTEKDNDTKGNETAAPATDTKKPHHSTHETETYSKSDDQTLMAMKAENKSWREILDELGKSSKSQLQNHYKDLEGRGMVAKFKEEQERKNSKHTEKNKTNTADEERSNEEKQLPTKSNNLGKKKGREKGKTGKTTPHNVATPKDNKQKPTAGTTGTGKTETDKPKKLSVTTDKNGRPDPAPNEKLLASMKHYEDLFEDRKWLAVASRHYDKTGERISRAAAKRMYDNRMG